LTEPKIESENRQDSEADFRTLAEQSPNMIFISRGGKVVYANRKCEEIMGYTREEFLAPDFNYLSLIAPESVDLVRANFQRHMNGEEIEPYEYMLISKSNKKIEAVITSKLIYFGGEPALLGIVTDITERKQAQRDLQKSEEKFHLAFHNSPIGMALCNMDGSIIQANPVFCQMLDYTETELKNVTFKDVTHPEDLEKQMPDDEKCVQGDIDSYQLDIRYIKKDGEIIWVDMTVAITRDKAGLPRYALIMVKDITEVRMAEENRQRLESQLRQAQKMEAGTLAGRIAHDFNNILGAIIGYSEMAIFDAEKGSMVYNNIEQVLKAGYRAKDLVKQILAFSRKSEQDKKIMQFDTIEMNSLPTGNEHILFIDDEKTLIDLGKNMLTKLGYQVTAHTSSIKAIETFKDSPDKFDLIISDMTMPNMTGDMLANEIYKIRPDIPIIICTGFSEQLSEKKINTLGIKGLLMKPLTISELAKMVRKAFDKSTK
jgi:PAS domain S-box-containing protein